MYISCIGLRINRIIDEMGICKKNFLFGGFSSLIDLWEKSIINEHSIVALRCEGLLLYTFSALGEQISEGVRKDSDAIRLVKRAY